MKRLLAILLITFMWGPALRAEEVRPFDKEAYLKSAAIPTELRINMVDCVAMALKNNSEILIRRISPLIADANVRTEKGKFEPKFSFDFQNEFDVDNSDSPLFGPDPTKTRTGVFNFGYDEKLVTGTRLSVDFNNTRTSSNMNPLIQSVNPMYDSKATVTVVQPLLKGFGIIVNKADFLIAKNNKKKSVQDLAKELISVLTDVKKSYYDFQYSQELYKVALASLKRAQDLYDINKERYGKGLASNVDILQSEAEVARLEQLLLAAENIMKLSEDNLKFITNLVDDPGLWNASIVLLDELKYEKREPDLIEAITKAFVHRPDYEAAKLDLKNRDITVIYNRNGMLPTLDLTGSLGFNGLGNTYEKDLGHVGGGKYQDWMVGASVKMPLFNDEEKGKYEKAKFEKQQALIAFKRLEQKMILEVRDAVRTIDIKYRMLEASQKSRKAEAENYDAQDTRFRAGLVSTLDMRDYQERLARAEANLVKSEIDYNVALLDLSKAQGTMLIEDNIKIE